jgi:alpha-galactosidase
MGWNSWNTFGCNSLNETLIKGVADTFVSTGMKDAGYQYVNLDDCWMDGRDSSGKIQANSSKFPSGMAALATYIHDKGLKIGLYSTPGTKTCANIYSGYSGGVGSLGKETSDAQSYAAWGVDYLKYDKCTADLSGFAVMRDALRATGRPIFYSINPGDGSGCVPGKCSIDLPATANMWRIGFDINASWSSMTGLIDQNEPLSQYAGPGHWNDPDMLEVGNGGLNATESRAHFSFWALLAAPLISGNDLRNMSKETLEILTNREVIAVDQDALGMQGRKVRDNGPQEVWMKPLADGSRAVILFNRGNEAGTIGVPWEDVGLAPSSKALVRDLWKKADLGSFASRFEAKVEPHGVVMLRIVPGP